MTLPRFRTVTRTQGNNAALKDGRVKPAGFTFEFEEVPALIDGFRRMVRGNEFDICEMALTTYLCAKAYGKPFTALPVFLVRGFHHGAISVHANAPAKTPRALEGKMVGVGRGYTVTTGVWARGVLQSEYGVDLSKITWVLSGDEHVLEYRPPANVISMPPGRSMTDMLVAGDLAATVGVTHDHPDVAPLIPDPLAAGLARLRRDGHYPINHLVVVRDELLQARPELAGAIFDAFVQSKSLYVDELRAGSIAKPSPADQLHTQVMDVLDDPLPYGIGPNANVLDELIGHAIDQRIIERAPNLNELFAPGTQDLVG